MKVQIGTLRKHTIFDDIQGTRWEVTDREKYIVYARRLSDGLDDCFSIGAEVTPVGNAGSARESQDWPATVAEG